MPPCLIGMEACVGAHHLSRKLQELGYEARLMPARYVRAYSKGQKNDFRDAEAIAEVVQRPTMKFDKTWISWTFNATFALLQHSLGDIRLVEAAKLSDAARSVAVRGRKHHDCVRYYNQTPS
jgi:transposase